MMQRPQNQPRPHGRRQAAVLWAAVSIFVSNIAVADDPADRFVIASRSFVIPFTVDAEQAGVTQVELLVADGPHQPTDQWQPKQASTIQWAPAAVGSTKRLEPFSFTAAKDGEYWFTTRAVDSANASKTVGDIPAEDILKVLVDTTRPVINIVADADGDGKIRTDVVIIDATKIVRVDVQYVTNIDKEEWIVVPYHRSGSLQFHPQGSWDEAAVVVTALDSAGNSHSVREMVRRPRVAAVPIQRYAALPRGGYDASPSPYRAAVELPPPATPEQIGLGFAQPDSTSRPSLKPDPSPFSRDIIGSKQDRQPEPIAPGLPTPDRAPELPLPTLAAPDTTPDRALSSGTVNRALSADPSTKVDPPPRQYRSSVAEAIKPIDAPSEIEKLRSDEPYRDSSVQTAKVDADADRPAPPFSPKPDQTPRKSNDRSISDGDLDSVMQRVPVRYSDSHRFSLEYEIESLGSRGVEAIELYGTVDQGRRWALWGRDADRQSPFDIEVRDDGVFGFRIVVVGSSGLASPRPLDGEEPDILVVVDRDQPAVRISGAKYGQGDEVGSLVVQYDCQDDNLKKRPIALAFAESRDGPWTTIAAGLQNSGRYAWPADPDLPRAFYLRIDATDRSGNVGTHVLDQPIDAQGLAPRAKIRGFRSL